MRIYESGYSDHFDGPGTRLIFYLKGCNFRCGWCGAPESLTAETELLRYPDRTVTAGRDIAPEEILRKAEAARDFISGVTFGGGEPTLQSDELLETLNLLRTAKIHTALESNASTVCYPAAAAAVDWLYSDLKTLNPEKFRNMIHADPSLLVRVRENLKFAAANHPCFTVRIPVVAGVNDAPEERSQLAGFLTELLALRPEGELKVELLRQHRLAAPKYRALGRKWEFETVEPPPRERLSEFAEELRYHHLNVTLFG